MEENIPVNLIVLYLSNEASSDEQIKLFDWISLNIENQKRFNEFCEAWNKNYTPLEDFNEQQALHALNKRIDLIADRSDKRTHWSKVAAVITLFAIATATIFVYIGRPVPSEIAYLIKTNPPGQKSQLQLSDGSTLYLNAGSSIKLPEQFADRTREVYLLHGEAFFEIQKDSLRPFIIHTGSVQTKVLGTSFNVRFDKTTTEVAVKSGLVSVGDSEHVELFKVNEKATIKDNIILRDVADLESILAWRNNTLIFDNVSLAEASTTLEMWYGINISFANNAIKECKIAGKFKNQTLENVLDAIAMAIEIEFEIKNKEVKIAGKGCH